ncbi:magnesium transporter CorA family protein [Flavobacterium hibisci]|uniref:hypothetical protein n=1 Tax=Flavobacterium hibisci TaxID=1914462 RepID=UPI001CBF5BC6|nr:hypothetical protein [Flavobacterium hibisci]MBZ4042412.1 hypothetical protein [Flavobacterium hibisci]
MILKPVDVALSAIMIDQFNPRFVKAKNITQSQLVKEMLESKSSKELLRSLQEDIKWVNRIVIQKIETHEYSDILKNEGSFEYVAIEGNTRLACLKSGAVKDYTKDTVIPVLIAEQEENESIEDFRKQVRITQGIANVTVVKEWSPISKAKHLLALYNDIKDISRPTEIYKQISNELGIGVKEVRESIVRYLIFNKISEVSEPIPEENWGYLEAFDKNSKIRSIIGLDPETNEFIENDEEYYIEILEDIPALIKQALRNSLNTKQFRDIIFEIVKETSSSEEFNEIKNEILNDEITLMSKMKKTDISDKEQWNKILDDILKQISSFPNMADWATDLVTKLNSIEEKTSKQIKSINS